MTHDEAYEKVMAAITAKHRHKDGWVWSSDDVRQLSEFLTMLEAVGCIKFDTPEDVHREGCKFIHDLSPVWGRTNPGAVVEDLEAAGYRIVRREGQ